MASEADLSSLQRPTGVRWLIFTLACTTSWMLYVHRYAWGVIKPEIRKEYGLSADELGWLDFAFQPTYGLFQVPGGLAGDLWGTHLILSGSIIGWSLAVGCLALAYGVWGFVGVRLFLGATQAAAYPMLTKVTRDWFPLRMRTSVQGVVIALGRLGGGCASLIVATLLMGMLQLDWRNAMLVLALPGILLGLAFWICFRDRPREHPWANQAECEVIEEGELQVAPGAKVQLHLSGWNGLHAGLLLLGSFTSTFADQFYVFWVPSFLRERGMPTAEMGMYAMLPLLGGTFGAPLGGFLNDYFIRLTGNRRWSRSGIAICGKGMAAWLTFLIIFIADPRWGAVMLFAVKLVGDWSLASQWGAITDMGGRGAGTLFGAVNTAGTVGAALASLAMGYTMAYSGWKGLFGLLAAVYLLTAIVWAFIDCSRRLVVEMPATPTPDDAIPTQEDRLRPRSSESES